MTSALLKSGLAGALALLAIGAAAPASAAEGHGHGAAMNAATPGAAPAAEEPKEEDVFVDAPADQALVGRLLMLKGHLIVGKELYDQNRPDDAVPHYLHPTEEIYGLVKDTLEARKIKGFEGPLKQLSTLVKQKKPAADVAARQAEVVKAVDHALAKAGKPTAGAAFIADTAAMVMVQAIEEYKESFVGDDIVNAVEYQDARGFVTAARAYFDKNAATLKARNADAFAKAGPAMDAVLAVFPAAVPPKSPVATPKDFHDRVARIEALAPAFR